MADKVTMEHPNLPDQKIEVGERAVRVYERSGWKVVKGSSTEEGGEPTTEQKAKDSQDQSDQRKGTRKTTSGKEADS